MRPCVVTRDVEMREGLAHEFNFYVDPVYFRFLHMVKALHLTARVCVIVYVNTSLLYHCYSMLLESLILFGTENTTDCFLQ